MIILELQTIFRSDLLFYFFFFQQFKYLSNELEQFYSSSSSSSKKYVFEFKFEFGKMIKFCRVQVRVRSSAAKNIFEQRRFSLM